MDAFSDIDIMDYYLDRKHEFIAYLKQGNKEKTNLFFCQLFEHAERNKINSAHLKKTILLLCGPVQDELASRKAKSLVEDVDIFNLVEKSMDIHELKEVMSGYMDQCLDALWSDGDTGLKKEVILVEEYIKRYYADKVSLESMAKLVCINKNHFSRLFKKETGLTFQEYLIKIRMDEAAEMITCGKKKIKDIASDVGYNDIFYFTRAFKNYFKVPPGVYKKSQETSR